MQYRIKRNEDGTFNFQPSGSDSRDVEFNQATIDEFIDYLKIRRKKELLEEEMDTTRIIKKLKKNLEEGRFPNSETNLFTYGFY